MRYDVLRVAIVKYNQRRTCGLIESSCVSWTRNGSTALVEFNFFSGSDSGTRIVEWSEMAECTLAGKDMIQASSSRISEENT